jgi:UDP-glucose 4-epimerase
MAVLVTGGTGYIGSHTVVELLNAGKDVVIVDNLSNSKKMVLDRIGEIVEGDLEEGRLSFYEADILDREALDQIFEENRIDSVIHFAGLKAVGESVAKPIEYYTNNISGTLVLIEAMKAANVKKIVFSSSATVYGLNNISPLTEDLPLSTTNPYGSTKMMIEYILQDLYKSDQEWAIALLRYFNPIGAHKSGRIGEDPTGIPNNLMPYITQVAVGKRDQLSVFGNDYDTVDGTGVRDYIHVVDLAIGHLKALDYIADKTVIEAINLGTGNGVSVIQMVDSFVEVTGAKVPYQVVDRRPGDVATCFADASKAQHLLGWSAQYDINDMCKDSWNWQSNNPNGYEE